MRVALQIPVDSTEQRKLLGFHAATARPSSPYVRRADCAASAVVPPIVTTER